MKKFSIMAMMFMALSLSVTMVSCGDDEPGDPPGGQTGGGGEQGGSGTGDEDSPIHSVTDVESQKARLRDVANALMSMVSASDFNRLSQLGHYVENATKDGSEVEEWFQSCIDACQVGASDTAITYLYRASNFHGQFELRDGRWELVTPDAGYLEFNFTDDTGKACSMRLICGGKETTIHHEAFDKDGMGYDDGNGNIYTWPGETVKYVIPGTINLIFSQEGSSTVNAIVETDVQLRGGDDEFDPNRDYVFVTTTVNAENYELKVERTMYNAGSEASAAAYLMKDGHTLVSAEANASGDITDTNNPKGSITDISISLLDEVYIRGSITDTEGLQACLDRADSHDNDSTAYKSAIAEANQHLNLGLYFGEGSTVSASLKYYPFCERGYYGEEWYNEVVMMFPDGTSYSTMNEYFSEEFFDIVITQFKDLVDSFVHLVDAKEDVDW